METIPAVNSVQIEACWEHAAIEHYFGPLIYAFWPPFQRAVFLAVLLYATALKPCFHCMVSVHRFIAYVPVPFDTFKLFFIFIVK
jgi:hypothetical protein